MKGLRLKGLYAKRTLSFDKSPVYEGIKTLSMRLRAQSNTFDKSPVYEGIKTHSEGSQV